MGGGVVHPWYVVFWYGESYAGGPATVVVPAEPGRHGFDLARAWMHFGANTDVRAESLAIHHLDGRLGIVA